MEGLAGRVGISLVCEDAYYRDQSHLPMTEREQTNYDHPNAFEHDLLQHHLQLLKEGKAISAPQYDFSQHTRAPQTQEIQAQNVVIVEGILLLSDPTLRPQFDIKVFIDTPLDICLLRRIERDVNERGRDMRSVMDQYRATVRPMYFEFIEPSKSHADVIVTGGGRNRVALDLMKDRILSFSS